MAWLDDLKQKAGVNSYGELKRLCEDREEWKKIMTLNWAMTLQTFFLFTLNFILILCVSDVIKTITYKTKTS